MKLAVVGLALSITTSALADTYVCTMPDGQTVAVSSLEAVPKECGPAKMLSDGAPSKPDPFVRFTDSSRVSHTPFVLSADRRRIVGQVRNDSSDRIQHISLYFSAYNTKGEKVSDPLASTSNLDAGETWNVEAYVSTDPANVAKIALKDYAIR